jgi:release factor glutamine methyltransferase
MTDVGDALANATSTLKQAGIGSARLDALILIEDVTGRDRAYLLAHPEHKLTAAEAAELDKKITRRTTHVPIAYIRGSAPFYGRMFSVNEHVLVPRPETEGMIELLKQLPLTAPRIADIGTGSGCIGITAALELPQGADVWLYDIDFATLVVAKTNAHLLSAPVHATQADMLEGLGGPFDALLANLPYVPTTLPVSESIMHEPELALFAGSDGLDAYRVFWQQVSALAHRPAYILTESLVIQHAKNAALAKVAGYALIHTDHLIQLFTAR